MASIEALDLLNQAICVVLYRRIAMAIEMVSQCGSFFRLCLVFCHPISQRVNTERVVTKWWHPVASRVAMDMLHWAMPSVLLQRACMTIEMGRGGGTFNCHQRFHHQPNCR